MGWYTKWSLLQLAAEQFDVLLTADQNLEFQQNLRTLRIGVVVLVTTTNRIESLRPLVPNLLKVLPTAKPGQVLRIGV